MSARTAPSHEIREHRASVPYLDPKARCDFWRDPRCSFQYLRWSDAIDGLGFPRELLAGETFAQASARVKRLRAAYCLAAYGTSDDAKIQKLVEAKIGARTTRRSA